jgi:hypothetical protein
MRRIPAYALVAFTTLATVPVASAQQQTESSVVQSTFQVEAAKANSIQFKLSAYYRDGRVAGNALAKGGSGNDIRVLILTEQQFQVWTRSTHPQALYDSGQRQSVVLSVPLNDPGTYYVVFDNRFSARSAKNIQADIRFVHRGVDIARGRTATVAAATVTDAGEGAKQARAKRVTADLSELASAVSLYAAHAGQLPPSLVALTSIVRNSRGAVAGPFLAEIPKPPAGWSPYSYKSTGNGAFAIVSSGDGATIRVP